MATISLNHLEYTFHAFVASNFGSTSASEVLAAVELSNDFLKSVATPMLFVSWSHKKHN